MTSTKFGWKALSLPSGMKKALLFLFILLLMAGTPWLSLSGLSTTALVNGDEQHGVVIVKGILSGDAEERAEEEDSREVEEDEDDTKLLNEWGCRALPVQLHVQLAHQQLLFHEHHFEIVVPPPKA